MPERAEEPTTRRRLLDAARQVVANKGFAGASNEAIARQAGLTIGAIYSNFENREDLIVSLYEELAPDVGPRFDPSGPNLRAILEDYGRSTVRTADRAPEPFLLSIEMTSAALRSPKLRRRRRAGVMARREEVAELLEAVVRETTGQLPRSAADLAIAVSVVGWAVAVARLYYGKEVVTDELAGWLLGRLAGGDE